jgi:Na+/proline symporter
MALLQLNISLDGSWLDNLIVGVPFRFDFGAGAIFMRRIRPSEEYFLPGRSLHSRMTSLVSSGAIEYRGHLRE